jgi:subfamily B ATP-binding cassette protein MsbA
MQANESQGEQRATSSLPLMTRLARLAVYFGHQRLAWGLAIAATLVGAVTEPMIPALLQPLLDKDSPKAPCSCGRFLWPSWGSS